MHPFNELSRRAVLRTTAAVVGATVVPFDSTSAMVGAQRARPRPTAAQLRWQRDELALFLHFGVNTFTDREWGDGKEDPRIFAPSRLDARQWARSGKVPMMFVLAGTMLDTKK